MINPLLVFFNGLIIFLFTIFAQSTEPRLSANLPSTLVVDHESIIEIRIQKGELSGFATFQMDLPDGINYREIENSGATVSKSEGQLIWTWDELPPSEELTISVAYAPVASAVGKKSLGGSFYYLEDNEKKSKDLERVDAMVIGESDASAHKGVDSSLAYPNSEPVGSIEVVKTASETGVSGEKSISITVKKGITKGFARYSDDLEPGYTARAVKTDGSSFSVADGKIKFVWVNVPEKDELIVNYVLIRKTGAPTITLKGEYSYLEHNQSKKVTAPDQVLQFEGQTEGMATGEPMTNNTKTKNNSSSKKVKSAEQVNPLQAQLEKQQASTHFEVQVGAFTNSKVKASTLKTKFKLQDKVRSEFQGGYSKFMIGTHEAYKNARDHREKTVTSNGVRSAFVVAYNNGQRISVQEALMTLNQKWFK